MRIASSVEYATRIMLRLSSLEAGATTTGESLSRQERIPRDYVNQLLMRLRRAGLVTSLRGVRGGYRLARPASEISVGTLVRAVDKGVFEAACERYSVRSHRCAHEGACGIRPVWQRLGELVEGFLDGVTLSRLRDEEAFARPAASCGRPRKG